jgi:hypothetical protein
VAAAAGRRGAQESDFVREGRQHLRRLAHAS